MNIPSETEPRRLKLSLLENFSKFSENKSQKLTMQFCKECTNIKKLFSAHLNWHIFF